MHEDHQKEHNLAVFLGIRRSKSSVCLRPCCTWAAK